MVIVSQDKSAVFFLRFDRFVKKTKKKELYRYDDYHSSIVEKFKKSVATAPLLGRISSRTVSYNNGIVPVYSSLTTLFTIKQKAVGNKGDKIFLSENIYDSPYFRGERKRERERKGERRAES